MIGTQIGKYEILAEIGRGGMGIVYHGVQKSLDRSVAIKVLPPDLANDSKSVQRFIQEANLIAKLDHDNIVKIYDIEEKDSIYYIIMEYLKGTSLENIIRNPSLRVSRDELVGYIIQVCDALHSAHQTGVIHRDVKSANIFVMTNGKAKLMDFGISKMISEKKRTTGVALGTPSYMSPEQAKGESLDHFSDIYSLGVVLYECLTAKLPFVGEDVFSVALKHISDKPESPSSVNSNIQPYLNEACLKSLSKDKFSRFQTCAEMGKALAGKVKEEIIVVEPDNKMKKIVSKATNEKIFFPLLALVSIFAFYFAFQTYQSSKDLIDGSSRTVINEFKDMDISGDTSFEVLSDKFEIALKNNQIDKATAIINILKKNHFDNNRIQVMEDQLFLKIKKSREKIEIEKLVKNNQLQEAFRLSLNLLFLYPEDGYFKKYFEMIKSKLSHREKEDKLLHDLIELRKNGDYDELLKMSLYYKDQYPQNLIGEDFVEYAREQLHLEEEDKQVQSAIERASFFKESNNFEQALEIVAFALELDKENVDLLTEEASIMQSICMRKLTDSAKTNDKDIYNLLHKMLLAFANKNLDAYLDLLDSSKKDFYLSEQKSAENLFALTDDIFNSLEIITCKVKGSNAQVFITWDVKAVFKDREGLFSIFKNKGYIDLVRKKSNWLISDFVWIK